MRKLDALRQFLNDTIPSIRDNPEDLHIFVDQGRIAATGTPSPSFEYRYRLNIILTDFALDPDLLMVPLLVWIAREQPQLLDQQGNEPFKFEADILSNKKVDISIELELREVVQVVPRDEGGFDAHHPQEPVYNPPFDGVPDGVGVWRIDLGDETLLTGNPPAP